MTKLFLTAVALAALLAGPAIATVQAAGPSSYQVAQSSPEEDCSKIQNAQARAACLKRQGR